MRIHITEAERDALKIAIDTLIVKPGKTLTLCSCPVHIRQLQNVRDKITGDPRGKQNGNDN